MALVGCGRLEGLEVFRGGSQAAVVASVLNVLVTIITEIAWVIQMESHNKLMA